MRFLLAAILISVLFASCSKMYSNKIEGRYVGTFTRTAGSNANTKSSNVTMHFSEEDFSGNSSIARYPAIGSGTYTASANKINAKNEGFYTADFDWTFIFNGEYNYEFEGNKLKIWKEYSPEIRDIYLLEKE